MDIYTLIPVRWDDAEQAYYVLSTWSRRTPFTCNDVIGQRRRYGMYKDADIEIIVCKTSVMHDRHLAHTFQVTPATMLRTYDLVPLTTRSVAEYLADCNEPHSAGDY